MTQAPTPGVAPSQTVGPFFLNCLLRPDAKRNDLTSEGTRGERIRIEGRVLDGDGVGVPDALVEIWQANAEGRYNHHADSREQCPLDPTFIGFGRSGTDEDGRYWFQTIRPGAVPMGESDAHMQAPHICVMIFARGLLNHVATRLYFGDEPSTADDPILQHVPRERRSTLTAQPMTIDGNTVYRWDIVLQGATETVFLNI